MFRIALISRWHVHAQSPDERYLKEFLSLPDCKLSCVWDEDYQAAKRWAEERKVEAVEKLEDVLSRQDVDGVLVTSCATDHKRILIAAAQHKKHIFTEKVLAYTSEEAEEIREAVKKNGVKFCIAFQRLAIKQLIYAKKLLDDGTLGRPVSFRCLCGHDQGIRNTLPEYWYDPRVSGGGAMIDLGFNCAYLARYIMGKWESVSSSFSYDTLNKQVEDTASCNVRFQSGAMGLLEASFVSPLMSVFELAVYGTKGAYYARFGGSKLCQLRLAGTPERNVLPEEIDCSLKSPVETWVDAVTRGASDEIYGIDAAVDLVNFMLAAYESHAKDGKRVKIAPGSAD